MDFSELLKPEAVKVLNAATSKKRLMQDISDLSEHAYGLNADAVLDALLARESLGPTGVGQGIALPHARLPDLDRVVGAFVLLDKPIDFAAVDRQPVDIAFALFAPEDAGVDHLKALALVSDFSLGLFIAMSLMGMQLWAVADLAGPLLILLAVQVVSVL